MCPLSWRVPLSATELRPTGYMPRARRYACSAPFSRLSPTQVSLNDRSDACKISGYLPIHAVTANSLETTYEYITKDLPEKYQAEVAQRSSIGRMPEINVHGLLPLQLAAKLGDHDFVKFMLRKQCSVLWIWGPVTMHSINLAGIDSAGEGNGYASPLTGI